MFSLNDHMTAAVFLEGKEVPLNAVNFMQSVHIASSSSSKVPLLVLKVMDQLNSLVQTGLQDGVKIKLSLNGVLNIDREFRVSSWSRLPVGDGYSYTINCYLDNPMYWAGTTSEGITGSSYEALATIAAKTGMRFSLNNTRTSDSMLWMPTNQSYSEFAKDIARYGYVGETSHMVFGVDSLGVMRYRDINANPKPTLKVGLLKTDNDPKFLQLSDFSPTTSSGTNNAIGGYMHSRYVQSGDAETKIKGKEDVLAYNSDAQFALLNAEVRGLIGRGGISYSPIDFGNVHPKYERAKYQNTRFDFLNSLGGDFLFGQQTQLEMFDNFTYVAPPKLGPTTYDGEYTVKAKIIYIAGSSYHEKIVAVKNGLEK